MADLWSSARLLYRGLDVEDEDFLHILEGDPLSFVNVAPVLPGKYSKLATTIN